MHIRKIRILSIQNLNDSYLQEIENKIYALTNNLNKNKIDKFFREVQLAKVINKEFENKIKDNLLK